MDADTIKKHLKRSGIELSDWQVKKIQAIISSGKMDLRTIEKLLLPVVPKYLMNVSLDVMSQIEIGL